MLRYDCGGGSAGSGVTVAVVPRAVVLRTAACVVCVERAAACVVCREGCGSVVVRLWRVVLRHGLLLLAGRVCREGCGSVVVRLWRVWCAEMAAAQW